MRRNFTIPNCRICGGDEEKRLSYFSSRKNFSYVRCQKCSSAYSKSQISIEDLASYYNTYYSADNLLIPSHVKQSISKTVLTFSSFRTKENSIFDLGYGAGTLLEAAQLHGWRCFGSEYSPEAIKIGEINGWKVHEGDLGNDDLPGPFDVVTIVETLEHVQNPNDLIAKASVRLRKGGLIYGTTPNGRSLNSFMLGEEWSVFDFPEHPILMSRKGIEMLLLANGFSEIDVYSQGLNPHDIIMKVKKIFSKPLGRETREKSRVEFGYELLEVFSSHVFLRFLKSSVNQFLSLLGIGDTLVFRAIRK